MDEEDAGAPSARRTRSLTPRPHTLVRTSPARSIDAQSAVEVLWEDQKRINSFGRLHNRKVELISHVRVQEVRAPRGRVGRERASIRPSRRAEPPRRTCVGTDRSGRRRAQKLVEDLEDASNEIMLSDDDVVKYTVGECYVHMDGDAAEERLTAEASRASSELDTLKKELDEINEEMASLKKLLYAKFKDQVRSFSRRRGSRARVIADSLPGKAPTHRQTD